MVARILTVVLAATLAATLAAEAQSGLLAVVNQKQHAVLLVDPQTGQVVSSISVGINGHEVAASPDGKMLYVPIYGDSGVGRAGSDGRTIDVIDVARRERVATIDLGRPLRPHKDAFGPDGKLYVSAELADAIEVLDVKTRKVVAELPTGAKESHLFALSPDGREAYTANVDAGSVSIVDVPGRKVLAVIPLTKRVQRMAVSNDGRWAFTSDWDQPRVAVIDTRSRVLSRWVATGATPYVTQPTPDGRFLLVAETRDGKGLLEAIDLANWKVARSWPLPSAQNGGFLVHDDVVYLSEPLGGNVERLDLKTWTLLPPFVCTPGVDGLAWAR